MGRAVHPPLTGGHLDRDGATRLSPEALDAAWADPAARLLRVHQGRVPVRELHDSSAELELVPSRGPRAADAVYLGRSEGAPVFALPVDAEDSSDPRPASGWAHPFDFGWLLRPEQAEMMAAALAIISWHDSAPFSARDGERTVPANGGWARLDPHGGEHFPRTDPVVIVRVEHEDRLLLGSNALWESGRFSLLAGFIDAGESAEEAVAREVHEESGARVDRIRYLTSQPWPFPRSLMLGFSAQLVDGADPAALSPDPTELSEVRWFTRDELRNPPPGILLPMPMSIARWMIDRWVEEGGAESASSADGGTPESAEHREACGDAERTGGRHRG